MQKQQEQALLEAFRSMDLEDRPQALALLQRMAVAAINKRPQLRIVVNGKNPSSGAGAFIGHPG